MIVEKVKERLALIARMRVGGESIDPVFSERDVRSLVGVIDQIKAENERFDEGMRSIVYSLGAGGYNAEHLRADELVDKVRCGIDYMLDAHELQITETNSENEALRQDAERYRFFRDGQQVFENGDGWGVTYLDNGAGGLGGGVMQADFTNLDEAIDFAMSKEKRSGRLGPY